MKNKNIIFFVLGVFALGVFVFLFFNKSIPVVVCEAKISKIVPTVSAYGEVKSRFADLSSKSPLMIKSIKVKEGDFVKKGQVLVEFENFETSKNDYETAKELYEKGLLSWAQFEQAKIALDNSTIISPFDGIVAYISNKVGETTIIGSPVIKVVDPNSTYVELQIDESDIADVKAGQKAIVFSDAFPNKEFYGKIEKVSKVAELRKVADRVKIDEEDKVFRAQVKLDKFYPELKIGMSVNADIILQTKENVLVVPRESIFSKDGKAFVYLVKNNRAKETEVVLGLNDINNMEVLKGLNVGDIVVCPIPDNFKNNSKVKLNI